MKLTLKLIVWGLACAALAIGGFILVGRDAGQIVAKPAGAVSGDVIRENGTPGGLGHSTLCPASAVVARSGEFSEDELKAAQALYKAATRGDADLVPRSREWAGADVKRRMWVCDIARNAKRTDALAVLARDALDACRGGGATYMRLFRTAKFLEECCDWASAREALDLAATLAKRRTCREDVAFARLRIDLAADGASAERLAELRRVSTSAIMNDNRLAATRLLKTYEH